MHKRKIIMTQKMTHINPVPPLFQAKMRMWEFHISDNENNFVLLYLHNVLTIIVYITVSANP